MGGRCCRGAVWPAVWPLPAGWLALLCAAEAGLAPLPPPPPHPLPPRSLLSSARLPPVVPPRPTGEYWAAGDTFSRTKQLNAYLRKKAAKEGVNLLSGKNSTGE